MTPELVAVLCVTLAAYLAGYARGRIDGDARAAEAWELVARWVQWAEKGGNRGKVASTAHALRNRG